MNDATPALSGMQEVMGPLPGPERRVPLDLQVIESAIDGSVRRWKITFATEPNDRAIAWLMAPVTNKNDTTALPAVLALHQTTRIGKDEPAGLGGLPNLHYARELAQRGYVVIVPDYPGFGEYRVDHAALGYVSGTMKGIWNHMRAVDVLESLGLEPSPVSGGGRRQGEGSGSPNQSLSKNQEKQRALTPTLSQGERGSEANRIHDLPCIDPQRIGCIGHSLGGHNSLFVAAFDPRIAAVVSSCGFTRFTWNDDEGRGKPGDLSDWTSPAYMPRIRDVYHCRAAEMPWDFPDVLAAIAPRAIFINAPTRDVMRIEGVRETLDLTRPIFQKAGTPDDLQSTHPDCQHDFPPDEREQAYRFLDRTLKQ